MPKGKSGRRPQAPTHIKDLVPDPGNLRVHNPRNIGVIVDSLQTVGAARSIVIDEDDVIWAGNGVIEAAAEAGITGVRVVESDGHEIIAVRRRGLTPEQKVMLAIADNRSAELATWKVDALEAIITAKTPVVDLSHFWSARELSKMVGVREGATDPEEIPETAEATTITRGDLFQCGEHRVLCGDATNASDVSRLMAGSDAAAMITDPPYGVGYAYGDYDDSDAVANAALVRTAISYGPSLRVWTPGNKNLARDLLWNQDAKVVCWYKKWALTRNGLGGASTWEPIMVVGGGASARLATDHIECTCVRGREEGLHEEHPCPKPVALWRTLVEAFTPIHGIVYDPFCGSGTTVIACEQTHRRAFVMEIDPRYVQTIVHRWERFAGGRANHLQ